MCWGTNIKHKQVQCIYFSTVASIILGFTIFYIDAPDTTASATTYNLAYDCQTDGCSSSNAPNHNDDSQIYHYVDSSRFNSAKHGADPEKGKPEIYHFADAE